MQISGESAVFNFSNMKIACFSPLSFTEMFKSLSFGLTTQDIPFEFEKL